MRTIYKYKIGNITEIVSGVNTEKKIYLPVDSKILCCKLQHGPDVCVWAELDTADFDNAKVPIQTITIKLFGTGWNMDELKGKKYEYLDTIYVGHEGVFVYYAYAIYE